MTSPAERAQLVDQARQVIEQGSKSFRFASRLFEEKMRERAWLLYAWCRACDDLADGQHLGHDARTVSDPLQRISYLRDQTAWALDTEEEVEPPFQALRLVSRECALPRRFIEDHLEGFARDSEGWTPQSPDDLLSYCYNVAGAVGCLMAVVMGVSADEEETLDRASDLGIAFQLANIARDIGDDSRIGRCYLPADWLDEQGLTLSNLMAPENRDRLAFLARRLCSLVLAYEQSARVGAARLPFRARWAVLSAARIYGGIARKIDERGPAAWDRRAVVPKSEKLRHVAAAAIEALRAPRPVSRSGLWTRPR